MVDTHAYCTHFIIDRPINISLWTGCLLRKARSEQRFCGPARDMVLTNRKTEKLNFDTNYITHFIINLAGYIFCCPPDCTINVYIEE
jgi:hypothetical protein